MSGIIGKSKARGSGIISTDSPVTSVSGSTGAVADADIDHDSLGNFASNEHFTQANITATGTVASGVWQGTPIAQSYIADNAINLEKLEGNDDGKIITFDASGDPVAVGPGNDGQVLTSTGAGSPPAFEAPHLSCAQLFRLDTSVTQSSSGLSSNWTEVESSNGQGGFGGIVSESGGTFTFSTLGFYLVTAIMHARDNADNAYAGLKINYNTASPDSYNVIALEYSNTRAGYTSPATAVYFSVVTQALIDVDDTTNCKLYLGTDSQTDITVFGAASQNNTCITFLAL